jgi:UDP-glucose 4-epimerase
MTETVLITGGAGAIGFHLASALADRGDDVILVDNYIRSERDQAVNALVSRRNVKEVIFDLCVLDKYEQLPDKVDYIYHLAAMNGTQNFYEFPFDVLVNSTLPTIGLLMKYGTSRFLKRFIYAGSSEAYASSVSRFGWEIPTDESVPLGIEDSSNVRWSYGGSKLHGELAVTAAGRQLNTPFSIIRYHNVYGPRMGDKHVIPDFIERAKRGIYELYGYEDTRSFIYVSDAVEATIQIANTPRMQSETIHLGSPIEMRILDLGKEIMRIIGKSDEIKCYPSPSGSVKRRAPNISKLVKITGFKQRVDLWTGLRKTIEFYAPELIT